jgi:hypothetical protein
MQVDSQFVKLQLQRIHFDGESILPPSFTGLRVLNKDPTVMLDGARPSPIKSYYGFREVIIRPTRNPRLCRPEKKSFC